MEKVKIIEAEAYPDHIHMLVELHGVSEGEEQSDDLREVPGTAV